MFVIRLTLNLLKVNSVESPNSCEVNYTSSTNNPSSETCTLSSDTYHTAADSCSPQKKDKFDYVMSDSGVELRSTSRPQDESDLSSNEDKVRMIIFC